MPNKLREIFSNPDDVTFEFDLDLTPEEFEYAMCYVALDNRGGTA